MMRRVQIRRLLAMLLALLLAALILLLLVPPVESAMRTVYPSGGEFDLGVASTAATLVEIGTQNVATWLFWGAVFGFVGLLLLTAILFRPVSAR